MATNAWKWAVGCGIGCLVIIVAAASLGVGGFLLARGAVREIEHITDLQDQVEKRFGSVGDYTPRSGAIAASRMEAFLTVREAMAAVMKDFDDESATFPPKDGPKDLIEGLKVIQGGVKAASTIGRLIEARNRTLLDVEMGFGEYYYLYGTVYYAWLGHSPLDCPRGLSIHAQDRGHSFSFTDGETSTDLDRAHRTTYASMLRRALVGGASGDSPEGDPWLTAIQAELDALEADDDRLPWAEGLPPVVRESLEPFRQRLEPLYWKGSNCFELTTLQTSNRLRERLLEAEEDIV